MNYFVLKFAISGRGGMTSAKTQFGTDRSTMKIEKISVKIKVHREKTALSLSFGFFFFFFFQWG